MGGELTRDTGTLDGTGGLGARKRGGANEYVLLNVPANYIAGRPVVVTYDGDEETLVKGVACATLAVYQEIAIVPRLIGASAENVWCQTKGVCQALVNGSTDVAKDDYLEIISSADNMVQDSTVRSVNSVAIACEAYADSSDALKTVCLLGDRVIIAGS